MCQKLGCAMLKKRTRADGIWYINIYGGFYENRNVYQDVDVTSSVGFLAVFSLTYLLNHVEIK